MTDVPRSGLGVRNLRLAVTPLEPNVYQFAGPWHYSVARLYSHGNTTDSVQVWPYKFDTTSIAWRAFAEIYGLSTFPRCLFYDEDCPSATLNATTVFGMIDSLVDATAEWRSPRRARSERRGDPVAVTLRARANFWDRLHHYLLRQLFVRALWRTAKATYYPPAALDAPDFRICRRRVATPLACDELWVNYRHSCARNVTSCQVGGTVWDHINERVRMLRANFPTNNIDLTIIDGIDDLMVNKGGFAYVGRRFVDMSTIIRARQCTEYSACSTVFLEDYRYETTMTVSDADDWFSVVKLLRFVGQSYFVLRMIGLFWSCYATRKEDADVGGSVSSKLSAAIKLFARLPSQTVVYGCPFPVLCYAFAHMIDSPITYEIVYQKFTTMMGAFSLRFQESVVVLTAIQMRSVWILALLAYALVLNAVSRFWIPVEGVVGIPEYVLAGMASLTVFSQYRSLAFRNTRVMDISELPGWRKRTGWTRDFSASHTNDNTFGEGMFIDIKCFLCEAIVIGVLGVLWCAWKRSRWSSNEGDRLDLPSLLQLARTPAPYTAGTLWPAVSLCILWRGPLFHEYEQRKKRRVLPVNLTSVVSERFSRSRRASITKDHPDIPVALAKATERSLAVGVSVGGLSMRRRSQQTRLSAMRSTLVPSWPLKGNSSETLRFIQFHFERIDIRNAEIGAVVAFYNLINMSDPLVWFRLRMMSNQCMLGYYQSRRSPYNITLLPVTVAQDWFSSDELTLLQIVEPYDLPWTELIQCG